MNHDRQFGRTRQFHLLQKYLLLQFAGRVIVKVVEPDLPPGNDLGPPCQLFKLLEVGIRGQLGFMRMNADCGEDKVVLLGKANAAVERPRPRSTANSDNLFHAAIARAGDRLLTVGVELFHVEMGVGVYEH